MPATRSNSRKSTRSTDIMNEATDTQRNNPLDTNIHKLATWAYAWIAISSVVVIWDASYVLLRPLSLKGGSLFQYYAPYALYITVDKLYGDVDNAFVKAQSAMNLVECLVNFIGLYIYHSQQKLTDAATQERTGLVVLLCSVSATLAKTILYGLHDYYHVPSLTSHSNWFNYITLYIIPNGLWIVVPLAVCVHIGTKLAHTNTSASRNSRSKLE